MKRKYYMIGADASGVEEVRNQYLCISEHICCACVTTAVVTVQPLQL
jgi:hypothetical protein